MLDEFRKSILTVVFYKTDGGNEPVREDLKSENLNKEHMGSNLDDFLREEQLLNSAETTAVKRVIAFQIEREMKRRNRHEDGNGYADEDKPCRIGTVIKSR